MTIEWTSDLQEGRGVSFVCQNARLSGETIQPRIAQERKRTCKANKQRTARSQRSCMTPSSTTKARKAIGVRETCVDERRSVLAV